MFALHFLCTFRVELSATIARTVIISVEEKEVGFTVVSNEMDCLFE